MNLLSNIFLARQYKNCTAILSTCGLFSFGMWYHTW